MNIISDKDSHCIVVAAGPGSGKTRVLVHKLASLLLLEDVKHEQLLMLTFSRAAAIEFKRRLLGLIGNAAHFVEIKTFHSYCFDLLGRIGNLDEAKNVVSRAAQMIVNGEVEPNRIAKTVLVIDEAQDMSHEEYALIRALISVNEDMRVIAVGDDDQNIFKFRGSDSRYMHLLLNESNARLIEMTENYRSSRHVVDFANAFVGQIRGRMKSDPIISMNHKEGFVSIHHHVSHTMFQPLVKDLLAHRREGSTCVLTQTNEEAVILVALLQKYGVNSKLVQSMDNFRFWNMAELRMFLRQIDCSAYSPDFKEFVFESSVEDFCDLSGADVVVSTIHKAKGREFDDVFMLIAKPQHIREEELRRYYVGITRAKERLFIHTDDSLFDRMPADEHHVCLQNYSLPDDIVLQLTHKDVNLGFFKSRKHEILALRAGDTLRFDNNYLYDCRTNMAVAQLSQKMQAELSTWGERGYSIFSASIRFVVAWRPKDATHEEKESAVLLIDLMLKKAITA